MKRRIAVAATAILFSVGNVKSQDTLVSAFFGLDNALPGLLCNQPGSLLDGMPVNFQFPLDASSLSETDFEVLDELGNVHAPICALLAPANENGENRTVLLLGEFGTAVSNPPVEVRIVGELFTAETFSGESACSEVINLNGMTTTNVVPLADGPSLFLPKKWRVISMNAIQEHRQFKLLGTGASHPTSVVMSNLTCSNTTLAILTVLEFWFRMHRFPSRTSMTTTIFTNCAFPPLMKSSKFQCWPTRSKTQTTTPICTAKLMSAPALLQQLLRRTFSKKGIRFTRTRSQMKYSSRICEAMNASSCMTSWGEKSSKESVSVMYKCLQQTQECTI